MGKQRSKTSTGNPDIELGGMTRAKSIATFAVAHLVMEATHRQDGLEA